MQKNQTSATFLPSPETTDSGAALLDTTGLKCPLPVLKARKKLREVPEGGRLTVLATDPGAVKDFEAFCEATGTRYVSWSEADGVYTILLERP
ncbi:MAG: sulfurtransferase TusA family protein [Alphaproteobacteria bacterium]|nr:sulfurtransferase TusA family protein [Alphaproteobacteria bacterium]MBU0796208.1 sulfurtransferase TusA family protein [Alphaproteobacteria bacterium]MBU0888444.1 sulfurtransferase TusA family protein [Alphaproteobacteria bacterium]MBU1813093.1 sulfurtransferase TusA family protein [Alphaproteobacteria bacterium]MBU2088989.1 sulfurtransferase TusA family protein [Alphaproteobacteria bacterium]